MVGFGALPRVVAASAALAALGGCEAFGFVGSNSGIGEGGGSSSSGGVVGESSSGAQSTAVDDAADSTHANTSAEDDGGSTTEDVRFDVGFNDVPAACEAPVIPPCDGRDADPWHALGLGCVTGEITGSYTGAPEAMMVLEGPLGTSGVFAPREGERMVILSTGNAADIPKPLDLLDDFCVPLVACPSTSFGGPIISELPPPIDVRKVSDKGMDCSDDAGLIGSGDCSNTLWDEWVNGQFTALDYAELRMNATVPEGADGLAYDFAFFSAEYPTWDMHTTGYNDMYIAWLESERWTGNVSFDEMGNPITANGVFLDYKDAPSTACPNCAAPELEGFSMQGHAGTKWLVSNAPVSEGEDITMVFAIFDVMDGSYDSAVILDNFEWTCSGAPPFTAPG